MTNAVRFFRNHDFIDPRAVEMARHIVLLDDLRSAAKGGKAKAVKHSPDIVEREAKIRADWLSMKAKGTKRRGAGKLLAAKHGVSQYIANEILRSM